MLGFSKRKPHIPSLCENDTRLKQVSEIHILSNKVSADFADTLISYPCAQQKLELVQKIRDEYSYFQELPSPGIFPDILGYIPTEEYIKYSALGFQQSYFIFFGKHPSSSEENKRLMQANKDLLLYMKDFQDIVVEMFSNLIKYYCKEPQSHKFLILIEWYKHKLSQNPSYEQKGFFELLDIFMIYKGDSTYFESIPKEYIEPIRDIITMQFMLNQVLYDIGKGITHKSTRNLQNMRSCINAVLGKIKQIKEQDFFNESVIATILGKEGKISQKTREKYEKSSLFFQLIEQRFTVKGKGGEKVVYEISGDSVYFIHQLVYSGWDFLIEIEECQSLLICLLGLNGELSQTKKSKILHFAESSKIKKISQEVLLIILFSDIEDHSYLDAMSIGEIVHFGDIALEKAEKGLYVPICSLSFLHDWNKEEVLYLLSLGKEVIISLAEGKTAKEDIIGIGNTLTQCRNDLDILFGEHPGHQTLSIFVENLPRFGMTQKQVEIGRKRMYRENNTGCIIEYHRALIQQGFSQADILQYGACIYRFVAGNIGQYRLMLDSFLALDTSLKEKFSEYLGDWDSIIEYEILVHNIHDFGDFLTVHQLWGDDMQTSYELFLDSRSIGDSEGYTDEKDILWPDFLEEESKFFIKSGYSEEIQKEVVKTLLKMNQSLQDAFMSFFINGVNKDDFKNSIEDSEVFSNKLSLVRKVLHVFQNLDFHSFHTPEKIFEFIFKNNISQKNIDFLVSRITQLDGIYKYEELLGKTMRFLKYLDTSIFDIEDDEAESQKNITSEKSKKTKKKGKNSNGVTVVDFKFLDERSKEQYNELVNTHRVDTLKNILGEVLKSDIIYDLNVYLHILYRYEYFSEEQKNILIEKLVTAKGIIRTKEYSECIVILSRFCDDVNLLSVLVSKLALFIKQQNGSAHPKNIARLFFSFQYLSKENISQIENVVEATHTTSYVFSAQDIYMMLYGILGFQETPNIKDLSQRLFSLLRTTETSDEVDDICIKRIHALYGEIITASGEERYNTAIRIKQKETPSFSETYIFREVQKVFPDALQGYFIDGYELDIYIPSINRRKLNIEFDGDGYHGPQKKQRDSIRDRYLKEKRGIYVYRVSAAEGELQSTTRALIKSLKQYR